MDAWAQVGAHFSPGRHLLVDSADLLVDGVSFLKGTDMALDFMSDGDWGLFDGDWGGGDLILMAASAIAKGVSSLVHGRATTKREERRRQAFEELRQGYPELGERLALSAHWDDVAEVAAGIALEADMNLTICRSWPNHRSYGRFRWYRQGIRENSYILALAGTALLQAEDKSGCRPTADSRMAVQATRPLVNSTQARRMALRRRLKRVKALSVLTLLAAIGMTVAVFVN